MANQHRVNRRSFLQGAVGLGLALPLECRASPNSGPRGAVAVGRRKQLLVDDFVIERKVNVSRELGRPTRENDGKPVLVADKPWEKATRLAFYLTVLWDEKAGKFRMWHCADMGSIPLRPSSSPEKEIRAHTVAYAESADGITWKKPSLGLYRHGDAETNVAVPAIGFSCFLDPTVAWGAPNKFKAAYDNPFDTRPDGGDLNGTVTAHSPDGLSWTQYGDRPVTGRAADTQNQILWDPGGRRYLLICREDLAGNLVKGENRGTRVMAHAKGNDLLRHPAAWKTLAILRLDRGGKDDYRRRQIHAFTDWIHEGVHFGFIGAMEHIEDDYEYTTTPADLKTRHEKNIVNFYLATSRDAVKWDLGWAYAGQPLLPRGPAGSWDKDGIHAPNLITRDDRHWIYYCGMSERFAHQDPRGHMAVGLASLRLDGFVCLEAKEEHGEVTTQPFVLEGSWLEVNVDAKKGECVLEVLNADSKEPFPGFGREEAQVAKGVDELRFRPRWKNQADLRALQGKAVRLKFHLKSARLYAFQVKK